MEYHHSFQVHLIKVTMTEISISVRMPFCVQHLACTFNKLGQGGLAKSQTSLLHIAGLKIYSAQCLFNSWLQIALWNIPVWQERTWPDMHKNKLHNFLWNTNCQQIRLLKKYHSRNTKINLIFWGAKSHESKCNPVQANKRGPS